MKARLSELRKSGPLLSVGALSANLMHLQSDITRLESAGVKLLHFDIMDGHFAPPLTAGPQFVKAIQTTMLKDVHLMIDEPMRSVDEYVAAEADILTMHVESARHVHRAFQYVSSVKQAGQKPLQACGLAITPSTPVASIEPFIEMIDIVWLVAINPGFPQQRFLPETFRRLDDLSALLATYKSSAMIGIDGGVTKENIGDIAAVFPDIIVTGSAVFEKNEVEANLGIMREKIASSKRTVV